MLLLEFSSQLSIVFLVSFSLACSTLQVKVFPRSPFGNQLFWFREAFFTNQVTSSKIFGTMATKMVATWRVAVILILHSFNYGF